MNPKFGKVNKGGKKSLKNKFTRHSLPWRSPIFFSLSLLFLSLPLSRDFFSCTSTSLLYHISLSFAAQSILVILCDDKNTRRTATRRRITSRVVIIRYCRVMISAYRVMITLPIRFLSALSAVAIKKAVRRFSMALTIADLFLFLIANSFIATDAPRREKIISSRSIVHRETKLRGPTITRFAAVSNNWLNYITYVLLSVALYPVANDEWRRECGEKTKNREGDRIRGKEKIEEKTRAENKQKKKMEHCATRSIRGSRIGNSV